MRRLLTGVAIVMLAAATEACFAGRYLYLSEDTPQELNATEAKEDEGGTTAFGDPAVDPPRDAVDAAAPPLADGAPNPNPTPQPDASPPKPPDPPAMCQGGNAVEIEPNGTVELARPLGIGKTCGALTLGDTDWFTMDIAPNGLLRVNFEADGDARLLIQSAGGGIAFATGSGGSFNFTTSGRWNLRVVSDTGRVQAYALVRPAP